MPDEKDPEGEKNLVSISAEVSDVFGHGKGAAKLFETIGPRLGQVFSGLGEFISIIFLDKKKTRNEAYRIRELGSAQADATEVQGRAIAAVIGSGQQLQAMQIADGKVTAQLIGVSPELLALQQRSTKRMELESAMHQISLESSVAYAAEELENEQEVSSEPVQPNWTNQWIKFAQEASSEEMQRLWGRILAGEVKSPGSFSPRTLNLISLLTQKEAQLFQRACAFNWREEDGSFVITLIPRKSSKHSNALELVGFSSEELQFLTNTGLIEIAYASEFGFSKTKAEVSYNGLITELVLLEGDTSKVISTGRANLTPMGAELASICQPEYEIGIMEEIIRYWIERGYQVSSPYTAPQPPKPADIQ